MQFHEVIKDHLYVIQSGRTIFMARHLHPLPGRDIGINLPSQALCLSFQRLYLFREIYRFLLSKALQLGNPFF